MTHVFGVRCVAKSIGEAEPRQLRKDYRERCGNGDIHGPPMNVPILLLGRP